MVNRKNKKIISFSHNISFSSKYSSITYFVVIIKSKCGRVLSYHSEISFKPNNFYAEDTTLLPYFDMLERR